MEGPDKNDRLARSRMELSAPRTLGWHSPSFRPISRDLLHSYRATAADMAPSLADVRTVRLRPAFKSVLRFMYHADR